MHVTYRCEEINCRKKFPWDPTDGYPKACPHCGYRPDDPDENVISMPAFLSAKTKAADQVIKQTIDGSSERALLAAQVTGESLADMNAMKLTDLQNDGSAKPVSNDVSHYMEQYKTGGFNSPVPVPQGAPPSAPDVAAHTQNAMQLAAQAHAPVNPDGTVNREPRAGARAMGSLQKALFNV